MAKQGVTSAELWQVAGTRVGALPVRLLDDCRYDIRRFRQSASGEVGAPRVVYPCVGRLLWDGGYEDYLAPKYAADAETGEFAYA